MPELFQLICIIFSTSVSDTAVGKQVVFGSLKFNHHLEIVYATKSVKRHTVIC